MLNLVNKLEQKPARGFDDDILILDGLNTLIRGFSANRTITADGVHVGGLQGFLKSLGSMVRKFSPTRVLVVWDGIGGAQNRKNIDEHYKANRAHTSVIHYDLYEDKKAESDSIQDQADRLLDYLACLPVSYIKIDKLEADDVIAYVSKLYSKAGRQVTIVSSDRDFLQLIDKHIRVYSPIKKILYDHEEATSGRRRAVPCRRLQRGQGARRGGRPFDDQECERTFPTSVGRHACRGHQRCRGGGAVYEGAFADLRKLQDAEQAVPRGSVGEGA